MNVPIATWKLENEYSQENGTIIMPDVPSATRTVHHGMKKYPEAVIVMSVMKEITKRTAYHHNGTSAYDR